MKNNKNKYYEWLIIGLGILMVFTSLGFCSTPRGLFTVPICDALQISRSSYAVCDSLRYITTAVVSIFFGTLVMRLGLKKLIAMGFVSLIISSFLFSIATNIWIIYLAGIFLGIGMAWTTTSVAGTITNRYCSANRGTVTGLILASNGLGGALATQVLSPIIYDETNPLGYQNAYRVICVILAVVAVIIIVLFPKPGRAKTAWMNKEEKKKDVHIWKGISLQAASKKLYFYACLICIFIIGCILQGVTGVAAAHLKDTGLTAGFIAAILSLHSIVLTLAKFLIGFIYDRFGIRLTSNICLVSAIAIMFLLAEVSATSTGKIFAFLYAILATIALPLETVMLPIFASEFFGEKSNIQILGIFVSVSTAGFATGAFVMNYTYDVFGSYSNAFYCSGILMIFVTIGMWFIEKAAIKERMEQERVQR